MIPELKHSKLFHRLYIILYLSILIFLIGFNFTDSPPPPFGWYQQSMPNLGGRQTKDMTFTDSLTGFAITNRLSITDASFILRTTNGGDNWSFNHSDSGVIYNRIRFINPNTGFVGGFIYINSSFWLVKTTDRGSSWFYINAPFDVNIEDLFALNQDTIWLVYSDSFDGGVFRTTNGGASWTHQVNLGDNPDNIYMFNGRIGFVAKADWHSNLYRTMNGGLNWSLMGTNSGFTDMFFADSLTGWECNGPFMRKTTNGGLNWVNQTLPYGGMLHSPGMSSFSNIGRDTIWGNGGYILYPNNHVRDYLQRTTNGGNNWLFQVPDTSIIDSMTYYHVYFTNRLNGWATGDGTIPTRAEIHTVTGGDTVWYTGIVQKSKEVPKNFILKQNYPNPFNPRTVINYELRVTSYVRLIVYDITGREVQKLVDQKQSAGEYEVDFMGKFVSSGVYLYRMQVTDEKGNASFSDTKKMILLK